MIACFIQVLFAAFGGTTVAGALLRGRTPSYRIDTYVINLDHRMDRCKCMQSMLADAPTSVYRQPAVEPDQCSLRPNWHSMYGKRNHTAEQSLFCSNYQVWKRAASANADFIVIMEDDVVLKPNFWEVVHEMIEDCADFDYLSVDAHFATDGGQQPPDSHRKNVCGSSRWSSGNLFRPGPRLNEQLYWGTAVQVIRKEFLPRLIELSHVKGMGTLDVWWQMYLRDTRVFAWMPGIVKDAVAVPQSDLMALPRACGEDILHSNIGLLQTWSSHGRTSTMARLRCGH